MDATTLPPGQRRTYGAILAHIEATGLLPSIRVLCDRLGIHSPNGVVGHLMALGRKGYTERTLRNDTPEGKAVTRTICPVGFRDAVKAIANGYRVRAAVGA